MEAAFLKLVMVAGMAVMLLVLLSCAVIDEGIELTESEGDDDARQAKRRAWMVKSQLASRDIKNERVLEAMLEVPRHLFAPESVREHAYEDRALPIGGGQTISQPYIVALMTQLADPQPTDIALDIGTGCGYQAAVLSRLAKEVYSIEIVPELAAAAHKRLHGLGYANVAVWHGDGFRGWPEHAPFDVIIVAAAPTRVPQPLVEQLAPGGRMVVPVGSERGSQQLLLIRKDQAGNVTKQAIAPVAFVPMTGEVQAEKKPRE